MGKPYSSRTSYTVSELVSAPEDACDDGFEKSKNVEKMMKMGWRWKQRRFAADMVVCVFVFLKVGSICKVRSCSCALKRRERERGGV